MKQVFRDSQSSAKVIATLVDKKTKTWYLEKFDHWMSDKPSVQFSANPKGDAERFFKYRMMTASQTA